MHDILVHCIPACPCAHRWPLHRQALSFCMANYESCFFIEECQVLLRTQGPTLMCVVPWSSEVRTTVVLLCFTQRGRSPGVQSTPQHVGYNSRNAERHSYRANPNWKLKSPFPTRIMFVTSITLPSMACPWTAVQNFKTWF